MNILELKEKFPYFFKVFPLSLVEFALSKDTAQKIANICVENHITNEKEIKEISFFVTFVFFDMIPKENLSSILEEKIGLKKEISQKITTSIDKILFSKILTLEKKEEEIKEKIKEIPPSSAQKEKDNYREKI